MKKLLYYTDSFCPISETFVYRTVRCINGYLPVIITHKQENSEEYPINTLPLRIIPRAHGTLLSRLISLSQGLICAGIVKGDILPLLSMARIIKEFEPVACYAQFALSGIRMLPVARALKIPLIVNCHACDISTWLQFRFYRWNLSRLFKYRRLRVLVPSAFILEKVVRLGCPRERISILHYPIPPIQSNQPSCVDAGERPVRFLHVGRLVPMKGILHTIAAFSSVVAKADCHLTIVGDGPERAAAESLVHSLKLSDKVSFLGGIPFTKTREQFLNADVFVLHSVTAQHDDTEGLPNAICEAMSAGLPVISTRHAGIPEVVQDGITGLLVNETDVGAQAEAMLYLARSRDLRLAMGPAGRSVIEQLFSFERASVAINETLASF